MSLGLLLFASLMLVVVTAAATRLFSRWQWSKMARNGLAPRSLTQDQQFHLIASACTDDGLVVQDLTGKVLWVNPAYCRIMGWEAHEMLGRNPLEYCLPKDQQMTAQDIAAFRFDAADPTWNQLALHQNVKKSGELFWNQINVSFHVAPDGTTFVILVCRDVTEEVENAERLREKTAELAHVATHDGLTGAGNRAKLTSFVTEALARARDTGTQVGLLQIDLDKFKEINDTHGHATGDAVLKTIADRVTRTLRGTDLLARIGGDEFVAVCQDVADISQLQKLGATICEVARKPFTFGSQEISPSISLGAVISETNTETLDELLRKADFALYEVKRSGRGSVAIYDERLHKRLRRKERRSDELLRAVRENELTFHFQPTILAADGEVRGFEALVRWDHPKEGMLLPAQFLPLAHDLGLMVDIDLQAMNAAMVLRSKLIAAGWENMRTGFNASSALFTDGEIHPEFINMPARLGLSTDNIVVELPESVLFGEHIFPEQRVSIVHQLHALGFSIVLDDFGAGFAGLMHLVQLEIDGFKNARGLMENLLTEPACQRTLQVVIELAKDIGLLCISVGVESEEQFQVIREIGGDIAQGHWIAQPMAADSVIGWLEARKTGDGAFCDIHPQLPPPRPIAI